MPLCDANISKLCCMLGWPLAMCVLDYWKRTPSWAAAEMNCNENAGQVVADRHTRTDSAFGCINSCDKLPKADACLVDFGVARVFADQQEVSFATDAPSDSATVPLDVILSLTAVQGVQSVSDDKGLTLQAVRVTQGLVLGHTCMCVQHHVCVHEQRSLMQYRDPVMSAGSHGKAGIHA